MAAKTSPAETPNKSDFIRNQPLDMSVATVVAIAKAQGLTVSDSLVRKVRGAGGPKANAPRKTLTVAAVPKAATPKKTAKKVAAKRGAVETKLVPGTSKADFIRAQPARLSAADVIAKAKAEGLSIHIDHVYKVRGPMGMRAKGAQKTTPAKPSAPTVTSTVSIPSTSATPKLTAKPPKSKADFVRAYPDLSGKELVGKAPFDGIDLTENYVYRVRAMDKAARKRKRAAAKTTTATSANGAAPSVTPAAKLSFSAEDLLRAVAAELGLGRAVEILAGERARVRAVMGG
jgi:hypothetical protein